MRHILASVFLGLVATVSPTGAIADEDFSVVVNPRTGAATLRNDSGGPLDLDGYLFTAGGSVFNTASWSSLEDQSTPGWLEGQNTASVLSEVNLLGSLTVPTDGTLPLGTPYDIFVPTEIGQPEPAFGFSYSVEGVGVFNGDVEFEVANNVVLVVDRGQDEAFLVNQSIFDVEIDSYLLLSGEAVFDPSGWQTLESSLGLPGGWVASPGSASILGEGNLGGSTLLAAGQSLSIGSAVDLQALNDETDIALQYSIAANGGTPGRSVNGGVLFTGAAAPSVPGDFDGDGDVDDDDFGVFAGAFGGAGPLGDFDNDGDVDDDDFGVFAGNFGTGVGSSASIPEPGSAALFALACCLGAAARRSNRV